LPEALVEQAAKLGMSALGILDRDGLYGAPRLYTTAKKLGLRSHVGAEVSVSDLGLQAQPAEWQPHTIPQRPVRLSLLCESQTGYRNLSQLITGYKLRQKTKGDGVATLREVSERCEGLVCLTGGDEGPLAAALERGGMDEGRRVLRSLVQTLGPNNVYVELQRHRIREQEARNDAAFSLSEEFHLPVLATNGVNMATAFEREVLDVLTTTRYGQLGAAMCANVITYRGKSAAREVGKSLGFDEDTLTRLTRLVSAWEWKGATDTMQEQFRVAGFDLAHPRIAKYLELSIRMLDLPRHLGQHSGGMIIAQGQLASVVPIEPASMPGRNVIQWDKEDVSDMGLIKVDLLGLGMMAVLKDCTNLIPQHYGKTVDIAQIPHDDRQVYASLRKADTIGLFQVESRAQMASLPRNNPDKFYDLVVQVAIIRPGPIVGKMMSPYMERRQGRQEITYPHPLLEPVLRRTLGVPLFQEQLLRIAMTIADFTGGEAEELRRALGSRRSADKMRALEIKLREGMDKNEVGIAAQEEIIQSISSFALYGFPESHAASFALIAYASAWLKFHYLGAFTAAILNNQPMGFYSAAVLVKDAQRHGLRVRPIDVMRSSWPCTLEREEDGSLSLRLGLRFARGLRETAAVELEAARTQRAFASIEELARRVPSLSRADLATLAEIGALNSIGEGSHRRDALWQVQRAGRRAGPLLDSLDQELLDQDEEQTSPLQAMNPEERMVADYAGTGVTVGRHPMAHCREQLRSMNVCRADDLRLLRHGVKARIAGCVIARQRPGTAHGFIFLSIEDETGISNAIIDPELYERNRSLVTYARFLLVEGTLQNVDKVIHIRAKHIEELKVTAAPTQSHDFH